MQLMNLHFRFRLFKETFETDASSLTAASSIVEKANSFLFFSLTPNANQSSRVVPMKLHMKHMKLRVLKWLVGIQKGVVMY